MDGVQESETNESHGLQYYKELYGKSEKFRNFLKDQHYKIVFNRNSRMEMPINYTEYEKFIEYAADKSKIVQ